MRYSGIVCPVCGRAFEEHDDVVVCPVCGTPHHRECWLKDNVCANAVRHEEGFEWKFPEGMDPVEILDREAKEKKRKENTPDFAFRNGEGVKVCEKCGAINYGNDAFCMRCHAPLSDEIQQPPTPDMQQPGQTFSGGFNPADPMRQAYENQRLFGGLTPEVPVSGIPAGELSDYIGGKTPGKFIRKYAAQERFGSRIILSIPAMLLGPVYFFYRKLFKEGALLTAVIAVLSFLSVLLLMTPAYQAMCKKVADVTLQFATGQISQSEYREEYQRINDEYVDADISAGEKARMLISELLRYLAYFTYLGCGLIFDKRYLKKLKKDVEEARAENNNMESYRMSLIAKGGTSTGGAVAGVLLMILSIVINEIPTLIYMFR